MYAVVSSGGKQYRVEPGSTLTMERLAADGDASVTFDRVLLVGDGETITVGTPTVSGATVSATILGEELGPKIVVFKFKQKVKYRRRTGHRQHLVRVRIDGITANGRTVSAEEAGSKADAAPKRRRTSAAAKAGDGAKPPERASAAKAPAKKPAKKPSKPRATNAGKASDAADTKRSRATTSKDADGGSKPARRRSAADTSQPKE